MSTYALLAHTQANAVNGGALTAAGADNVFGKSTLNSTMTDSSGMIASLSSDEFVFASTGTVQIDATVGYGFSSAQDGVGFRAGLYNVTSAAFVNQVGGAVQIISDPGQSGDPNAGTATLYVDIKGRFTVPNNTDHYAIYAAGKSAVGTWYTSAFAQGSPASLVTTGTKNEIYKLVALTKE